MEVRPLGAEHRPLLEQFICAWFRQASTEIIEETIRERLADALAHGRDQALGLWDDDALVAVVAWAVDEADPSVWTSNLLAVRIGSQRHGYGRQLKEALLACAREKGASVVVSFVHQDNTAMIRLNEDLGAVIEPDPDDLSRRHLLCTINL